jgi:membrane protein YqaA with SNARE-associated domain
MECKKIIVLFVIILLLFFGLTFLYFFNYYPGFWKSITHNMGGIFMVIFLMDVIIQPISPDVVVFGANIFNNRLLLISLIAGISSVFAGTVGHLIGKKIGTKGFVTLFGDKHILKGKNLFEKWGPLAIIVAAISPIPYSVGAWLSGIYRMNTFIFISFSLIARIPRFLLFGYLGGFFS